MDALQIFLQPESWIALGTLTFMEIVLGIDNILFISIVTHQLPVERRKSARILGLSLALMFRIAMLFGITWMTSLENPLFTILEMEFSIRDLILAAGGLFLLVKSTLEIHRKSEGEHAPSKAGSASWFQVILTIVMLDIVFSLDSILTAVGMTDHLPLMIVAVVIAMLIMIAFAEKVAQFINERPSLQILALAFLILIAVMLILDAAHYHIPKGYIYFALFFSLGVELLNLRITRRKH